MSISRWTASLIVLACPIASLAAAVEDWPKWQGPRGDNISKETLPEAWPDGEPKRVWEAQVGEGHASPVAVDGKIYLFALDEGNEETLTCFDAGTGKVAWKQGHSIKYKPQYQGTRATPTIEGDRIYTLGEAGDLVCRNLADGKQLWRTNVLDATRTKPIQWGCASSPLIVGDHIFVQTGEGGPTAVSVDKKSGKVEWKSESTAKAGYASLVHAEFNGKPQLIIFAGQAVGGIDPKTGKTIWNDKFVTDYDVNAATPIVRGNQVLFSSEYQKGKGALYEITDKSWKKIWESKNIKSRFHPPILEGDIVYANSQGSLVCVNWADGKPVWKLNELKLGVGGSFVRTAGERMIAMSERGKLSLVSATPTGAKLLGGVQLFEGNENWSSPLVYDGKVYCKGKDEFVCLDLAGK